MVNKQFLPLSLSVHLDIIPNTLGQNIVRVDVAEWDVENWVNGKVLERSFMVKTISFKALC